MEGVGTCISESLLNRQMGKILKIYYNKHYLTDNAIT